MEGPSLESLRLIILLGNVCCQQKRRIGKNVLTTIVNPGQLVIE